MYYLALQEECNLESLRHGKLLGVEIGQEMISCKITL